MIDAADVELESIRDCLRGGHPAPLATCAADGTPHVSYVSQVCYLDRERVATTRQAFNRALAALSLNPSSQALVVWPERGEEYRLDLLYLHTATEGEDYEAVRASLDGIATQLGIGPAFRLRGIDVHRVLRCTRVRPGRGGATAPAPDPLAPLERLARRLERCRSYEETVQEVLGALDDLFGLPYAVLFRPGPAAGELTATAASLAARSAVGTSAALDRGLVGTAARRRRSVVDVNLGRSRALAATVHAAGEAPAPQPGLAGARNAAAVPLIVGDELLGVLYLESCEPGAFGGRAEGLLRVVGAHAAAALAARAPAPQPVVPAGAGRQRAAPLELVYYQADDTVLCDSAYIVKGAPGRILWAMLASHVDSGRTQFSNRELRLDETIGLPPGNDNLEARLLTLRRRLAAMDCGVTLERVGRGRLELALERPARLTVVRTAGPMRHAHAGGA